MIKIRGPSLIWEKFDICRILVKIGTNEIFTCFENISAPVKLIGREEITEYSFHQLTQYDLEFVTRENQTKTSCGKMSIVLQGNVVNYHAGGVKYCLRWRIVSLKIINFLFIIFNFLLNNPELFFSVFY